MEYVALVTGLALVEYVVIFFLTGRARDRYKVQAPATTGHPIFERYYRVQQNTVEQLILFLPALWLFGYYLSGPLAAVFGLVFIVGRAIYLWRYVRDPEGRGLGFAISSLASLILLGGALVGVVLAL